MGRRSGSSQPYAVLHGNDSNIPFAKWDEAQQILNWITLYPTKVGMRQLTCLIPYIQRMAAIAFGTAL